MKHYEAFIQHIRRFNEFRRRTPVSSRLSNVAGGAIHPDVITPPEFLSQVIRRAWSNRNWDYSRPGGGTHLRRIISLAESRRKGGGHLPAESVICTPGATSAIYPFLKCLMRHPENPVTTMLLATPFYPTVWDAAVDLGMEVIRVPFERLRDPEKRLSDIPLSGGGTVLMLNLPSNPLGQTLSRHEIIRLVNWCDTRRAWLFVDEMGRDENHEAYECDALLTSRVTTLYGPFKKWGMGGVRAAYLLINDPVLKSMVELDLETHVGNLGEFLECLLSCEVAVSDPELCRASWPVLTDRYPWLEDEADPETTARSYNRSLLKLKGVLSNARSSATSVLHHLDRSGRTWMVPGCGLFGTIRSKVSLTRQEVMRIYGTFGIEVLPAWFFGLDKQTARFCIAYETDRVGQGVGELWQCLNLCD